jgi:hypothetical protein
MQIIQWLLGRCRHAAGSSLVRTAACHLVYSHAARHWHLGTATEQTKQAALKATGLAGSKG